MLRPFDTRHSPFTFTALPTLLAETSNVRRYDFGSTPAFLDVVHQGFVQDFFLGVGNVDACNRRMRTSIYPLEFSGAHLKASNHRIQFKPIILLYFLIVLYTLVLCQACVSLVCCRWHCYSCCALITIQTATNS